MSELKTVLVKFNASELREYLSDKTNKVFDGELYGEPVKLYEVTSIPNRPLSIIVKRTDGKTLLTNTFFMRVSVERYMTQEECIVWLCTVGYKNHMVRVNKGRWEMPHNFYFDSDSSTYEYRQVSFASGTCKYSEPQKFVVNLDLDPKLQGKVCQSEERGDGICKIDTALFAVNEFVEYMKLGWSTKQFLAYIFDCVDFAKFIGVNSQNEDDEEVCVYILKEYLVSYALGHIPTIPHNDARHLLLVGIYRYYLNKGLLPRIELIKC